MANNEKKESVYVYFVNGAWCVSKGGALVPLPPGPKCREDAMTMARGVLLGIANPSCPVCGARALRWGWYEAPNEPLKYWICLDCDIAKRAPCIFAIMNKENE